MNEKSFTTDNYGGKRKWKNLSNLWKINTFIRHLN